LTTILIVDDDAVVRKLLGRVLCKQGYTILSANNGPSALQQIHDPSLDLIITEIFIPELLYGLEFICKAKMKWPDVKLIAMSDSTNYLKPDLYFFMAMNLGAVTCLTKPIGTSVLLKTINDLLDSEFDASFV
jgi:CheY-like chemotaxis protein